MSAYHIQPGEDENWCQSSLIYWYWCTDSLLYRPFIFRLGVYIFNATHCIVVPIRSKAFSSDSVDLNKAAGHLNIRLHLHQLAFASSSWSLLLACHLSKCRRPQVFSLSRSRTSSSDMNGCIILLLTVVGGLLKAAVTFFCYRNINLVFWRRKLKLSLRAAQSIIKPPNIVGPTIQQSTQQSLIQPSNSSKLRNCYFHLTRLWPSCWHLRWVLIWWEMYNCTLHCTI